jgi:hypothetical protein
MASTNTTITGAHNTNSRDALDAFFDGAYGSLSGVIIILVSICCMIGIISTIAVKLWNVHSRARHHHHGHGSHNDNINASRRSTGYSRVAVSPSAHNNDQQPEVDIALTTLTP